MKKLLVIFAILSIAATYSYDNKGNLTTTNVSVEKKSIEDIDREIAECDREIEVHNSMIAEANARKVILEKHKTEFGKLGISLEIN